MNSHDLINMLATELQPVPRHAVAKRNTLVLLTGVLVSLILLCLIFGVRQDLPQASQQLAFWIKLGVPLSNALLGLSIVLALAYPGQRPRVAYWLLTLPILCLWGWALWVWTGTTPSLRMGLLWGSTWKVCVMNITLLAVPVAIASLLVLRHLAPTRPILTGALAGWFAGGVGAGVYALHCPEMAAPFLAVWYVLGMLLPTVIMAYLGHRWLRW